MARGKGEDSIYKRASDGLWCVSIELPRGLDGKRRRKTICRKKKSDLLEARRKAREELKKTGNLATRSLTLKDWLQYWLSEIAEPNLAPNTVSGYRNNIESYIVPLLGSKRLDQLTPQDVRRLHEVVQQTPVDKKLRGQKDLPENTPLLNSTSALLAHNTLSVALKAAMREGKVGFNACDLVDRPKKAVTEKKYLTYEEAVHLLKYVSNKPNGAMWATFLLYGTRRGEGSGIEAERVGDLLDISWQVQRILDISKVPKDFEYRHIRGNLYFTRPKSSAGWRTPPLVEPLKTILARHIGSQKTGPIFLDHKGEVWDPGDVSKAWKKLLGEAGLPTDVELHGSRRTTVTLLYEAGVPEHLIKEIVGHSDVEMTRHYNARSNTKSLTEALNRLSDYLAITE